MSFYGLHTFEKNLRTVMKSKAFKEGSDIERAEIGYRLFNSKYGKGSFFGFGKVKELKEKKKK